MTEIRPWRPGDREACVGLFDSNVPEFFRPGERTDFYEFLQAPPGPCFVAVRGQEVLACGGVAEEGFGEASICWTVVARSHQGKGLGRRILEECHRAAAEMQGVRFLRLETIPAVAGFFGALGYGVVQVDADGYGDGLDRVIMRRRLGPPGEAADAAEEV